ncbi:MAG TPA: aminoacyl-tRNA hydrolase [Candidatus Saccharimonadales bacterium]|nr:aminoacyl-tRNA hydrolase [Candidatus Saccharimonadales bacterium]
MKLIVGLGNVGAGHDHNRHNLGFMVVNELAQRMEAEFAAKPNWRMDLAEVGEGADKQILAKPTTMMNLSGQAIGKVMQFYKLEPSEVWVIHDELDLQFGQLRVREGGGDAGHNGVKSVISSIGPHCIRWRIGIGRPPEHMDSADFVLQNFSPQEVGQLPMVIKGAADAIEQALDHGHEDTTHKLLES